MSGVKLRYYQARVRVRPEGIDLAALNRAAPPGGPPAEHVTERLLFTPDEGVYLCEMRPSTWMEVMDYGIEFGPGVGYDDMPEEVAAYWQDVEVQLNDEPGYYVLRSEVVSGFGDEETVTFRDWLCAFGEPYFQGEYVEDGEERALDQAREDAQGNHYV